MAVHLIYVCTFVVVFWIVCTGAQPAGTQRVRLGVILPSVPQNPCSSMEQVRPVLEFALGRVNYGLLDDYSSIQDVISHNEKEKGSKFVVNRSGQRVVLEAKYVDSRCSDLYAPIAAMNLYYNREVDVYFGPCCKYALSPVARYTNIWGLPVITPGGLTPAFSDKSEFPLLTRFVAPYDKLAIFMKVWLEFFEWRHVGLIWHNNILHRYLGNSECDQVATALITTLRQHKHFSESYKDTFDEHAFERFDWDAILSGIKNNSRSK